MSPVKYIKGHEVDQKGKMLSCLSRRTAVKNDLFGKIYIVSSREAGEVFISGEYENDPTKPHLACLPDMICRNFSKACECLGWNEAVEQLRKSSRFKGDLAGQLVEALEDSD